MSYLLDPIGLIFCIIIGWGSKASGIFLAEDYCTVSKIVVNITLPILIIYQYQNFEQRHDLFFLVILGFVASLFPLVITYFLTGKLEMKKRSFMMLHAGGYNIGGFALPVILALLGPQVAMAIVFFDVGNAIMMTGGSYALTTKLLKIKTNEGIDLKGTLLKFIKSPPFMMYMFVIILYILGVQINQVVFDILRPIAQANSFLATFMLGMMFESQRNKNSLKIVMNTLVMRWVCFVFFSIFIFIVYQQDIELRKSIILLLASPIGTLSTIYTDKINGDTQLSSYNTTVSIFISVLVMMILYNIL